MSLHGGHASRGTPIGGTRGTGEFHLRGGMTFEKPIFSRSSSTVDNHAHYPGTARLSRYGLAFAAGCRHIVTHNLRDFDGSEQLGVPALSPREFLDLIRNKA